MDTATHIAQLPKSFSIYQANGKRKDGLKKAFVEVLTIPYADKTIKLPDGSVWPLFFDGHIPLLAYRYIVSFQVYTNGDFFAVARLYKDKAKA